MNTISPRLDVSPPARRARSRWMHAGVVLLSLAVCGTAHAQMRMWKRGAPGGFNAVLYLQNSGGQAQQCNVSWANANGGFGDGLTVIVQPGETKQIQTGVVAVSESYRCNVYVDPFKKREQERLEAERRKREQEALQRQREEEAKRRNQQIFGSRPQQNQVQGGTQNNAGSYAPSSSYTPAPSYTPPPTYTPPPSTTRRTPSTSNSARNLAALGAVAQAFSAMSESSAAADAAREQRERYETAQRERQAAIKARNIETNMQRAMQEAVNAPDVNPWGVQ
ncbi:MAG TPA: hypothetical protein VM512_14420 [Burkholderiaceae bacterium]|nr:hypothetical protein [Burkholderiaceae bacterium]